MSPITIGGWCIQHVLGNGILGIYYIYRMVVTIPTGYACTRGACGSIQVLHGVGVCGMTIPTMSPITTNASPGLYTGCGGITVYEYLYRCRCLWHGGPLCHL